MKWTKLMAIGTGIAVAVTAAAVAESGEETLQFFAASADAAAGGVYQVEYAASSGFQLTPLLRLPRVNYLAYDRDGQPGLFSQGGAGAAVGRWGDKKLSMQPTGGDESCHLLVSPEGNFLYSANYSGGNISEYILSSDAIGKARVLATPRTPKQNVSHPHQCVFTPDGNYLVIVDLGTDAILAYPYDSTGGIVDRPLVSAVHAGAGPRHLVFAADGTRAYVANELDGTVSQMAYRDGKFTEGEMLSVKPTDPAAAENYPAAIRITGGNDYLLVSVRGPNVIAVIPLNAEGGMKGVRFFDCGGDWPRDFIFSPDERFVVVANERSGNVQLFRWKKANGELKKEGPALPLPQALALLPQK